MSQFDEAIADFTSIIEGYNLPLPQQANALFHRGNAYRQTSRFEDAIADYTKILEVPDMPAQQFAVTLFNRGIAYGKLQMRDQELADYAAVLATPGIAAETVLNTLLRRAMVLMFLEQFEGAKRDLEQAQQMNTDDHELRAEIDRLLVGLEAKAR